MADLRGPAALYEKLVEDMGGLQHSSILKRGDIFFMIF
jgi:hypothetical protein